MAAGLVAGLGIDRSLSKTSRKPAGKRQPRWQPNGRWVWPHRWSIFRMVRSMASRPDLFRGYLINRHGQLRAVSSESALAIWLRRQI